MTSEEKNWLFVIVAFVIAVIFGIALYFGGKLLVKALNGGDPANHEMRR